MADELDPARGEALVWLRAPDILDRLLEAASKPDAKEDFLVGEDENVAQLILEMVARQSLLVDGASSGGKNSLVDAVTSIMPVGWVRKVSDMTENALRWLKEDALYHTLYLAELRPSGDEESTSQFNMKLLISEGELVLLFPKKGEGGMESVERRVKVDQFLLTSSRWVPPELLNRLSVLHIRDDEKTTGQVVRAKLKKRAQRRFTDYLLKQGAARWTMERILEETERLRVITPFAESLDSIIPKDRPSSRRDTEKLSRLIEASAKLHFMQRPIIETDGEKQIVASIDDLWLVLEKAGSNLRQTLGGLTDKEKELLDLAVKVQPLTAPELVKAARKEGKSDLYSSRTLRQLVASLREKQVLIAKTDAEGKEEKGYHGSHIYEVMEGSKGATLDRERIILGAWESLLRCEYASPQDFIAAIDLGPRIAADSGKAANIAATPEMNANAASDTMAAKLPQQAGA